MREKHLGDPITIETLTSSHNVDPCLNDRSQHGFSSSHRIVGIDSDLDQSAEDMYHSQTSITCLHKHPITERFSCTKGYSWRFNRTFCWYWYSSPWEFQCLVITIMPVHSTNKSGDFSLYFCLCREPLSVRCRKGWRRTHPGAFFIFLRG